MDDQYPKARFFEEVAQRIKDKNGVSDVKLSNDELLILYALFKQAKDGDNTTEQPSFYQLEAKAKWNAWNTAKGKSKAQAQHEYVVNSLKVFTEDVQKLYA